MAIPYYAIIVAGGVGTRMGTTTPKQFLPLLGKPVLMHTLSIFANLPLKPTIILVLPKDQIDIWESLCTNHNYKSPHSVVAGGQTRYHSVKNGLAAIEGTEGIVAIHDGVRPLVSPQLVLNCYKHALSYGNAVPAVNPVETVRLGTYQETRSYSRDQVWLGQTPQVFSLTKLKTYYKCSWCKSFTDDASVAEAAGEKINLVEGNRENIKITNQLDLMIAAELLKNK